MSKHSKKLKPDERKPLNAPGLIGMMNTGYKANVGDVTAKDVPKLTSSKGLGIVGQFKRKARH